jgi:hypothetical protein
MMIEMPESPYYNHVMFMGLSKIATNYMNEIPAKSKKPTNISLNNLISDRSCAVTTKRKIKFGG